MSRQLSFQLDDESNDVVKRYEQYLSGKASGYFDVEELENIVEYYLRQGRTKDCNKVVDLGLKLHPNNNILQTKRAKIYLATGDDQKAFRVINSIPDTSDYEVVLVKIEVLLRLSRVDEARMLCDKLVSDESGDLDNVLLDIAYIFLSQGEYAEALQLLKKGDEFNNKNSDLLYELAFCYEQNEDYDAAIVVNKRILDLEPFANEAWFNLGQLYFAKQDFRRALDAYDYALAIDETDMLTCLQKGHVLFQLNDFEEAIETYKEYRVLASYATWQTDIFIAECYEKLERYDESITYYRSSLEAQPENFDALTGVAICLLEQEKFAESITYTKQALVLNENAEDAWVYLAEAYIGIDDIDNALLAYIKSITIDPEQPDTLMAVANICMEKLEFELALKYYFMALKGDNSLELIQVFIAVAFYKLENYFEAKNYLQNAINENENAKRIFLELCPEALEANIDENDLEIIT